MAARSVRILPPRITPRIRRAAHIARALWIIHHRHGFARAGARAARAVPSKTRAPHASRARHRAHLSRAARSSPRARRALRALRCARHILARAPCAHRTGAKSRARACARLFRAFFALFSRRARCTSFILLCARAHAARNVRASYIARHVHIIFSLFRAHARDVAYARSLRDVTARITSRAHNFRTLRTRARAHARARVCALCARA